MAALEKSVDTKLGVLASNVDFKLINLSSRVSNTPTYEKIIDFVNQQIAVAQLVLPPAHAPPPVRPLSLSFLPAQHRLTKQPSRGGRHQPCRRTSPTASAQSRSCSASQNDSGRRSRSACRTSSIRGSRLPYRPRSRRSPPRPRSGARRGRPRRGPGEPSGLLRDVLYMGKSGSCP